MFSKRIIADLIDLYISYIGLLLFLILVKRKFNYYDWEYIMIICNFGPKFLLLIKDLIFKNASIGKKILRLEIKKQNDEVPKFYIIVLRNVFTSILFPIEFVMIIGFSKTLGDMIFKTKVVEKSKLVKE